MRRNPVSNRVPRAVLVVVALSAAAATAAG